MINNHHPNSHQATTNSEQENDDQSTELINNMINNDLIEYDTDQPTQINNDSSNDESSGVESIKTISLTLNNVDLTHEMTFEIISFLNTFELTLLSMLNKDWYEYICGQSINSTTNDVNTPCTQLWKYLLKYEIGIFYFPFQSENFKMFKNERVLCQKITKYYFSSKEISKSQFSTRSEDPTNLFFRIHVKGHSKTGKTKIVNTICGLYQSGNNNYEPTIDFRIAMRGFELKLNNTSKYIQVSFQDHGGAKSPHARKSIFSANLYSGKTYVLYVFNEDLNTLQHLPMWKLDTNDSLGGLKVKSNSNIGRRFINTDDEQLHPMEIMLLNCFENENNLFKHLNNNLELMNNSVKMASKYEIPLLVCDAKNVESVKHVITITNILELILFDILQ